MPRQRASTPGRRVAGRKMSLKHCARCHVIGDFNPFGGIGSTPSSGCWPGATTGWSVSRPFTSAGRIRIFVRVPDVPRWTKLPPHVKEFRMTPENIQDIFAFAETLRRK